MPSKPLKICSHPGCPNLTSERFCPKHAKQERQRYDRQRGSAAQRGYDGRWQRARLIFMDENPLCVYCLKENQITPATVVDHITPHKGDMKLFWDRNNWQSLCEHHHNVKTAKEDGGFRKI